MIGHSRDAQQDMFGKIVYILTNFGNETKAVQVRKLKRQLNNAKGAVPQVSNNMARQLYRLRKYLQADKIYRRPTNTTTENPVCSYIGSDRKIDCEQDVTPWACGGRDAHDGFKKKREFGVELMFAYRFAELAGTFSGKQIGITKIAVGGTRIKQWMKSDGSKVENYWNDLKAAIESAAGTLKAFVWFQGENDAVENETKEIYLRDLTKFVADVRQEIFNQAPSGTFAEEDNIPVIIVELGAWGQSLESGVVEAQREFVAL